MWQLHATPHTPCLRGNPGLTTRIGRCYRTDYPLAAPWLNWLLVPFETPAGHLTDDTVLHAQQQHAQKLHFSYAACAVGPAHGCCGAGCVFSDAFEKVLLRASIGRGGTHDSLA